MSHTAFPEARDMLYVLEVSGFIHLMEPWNSALQEALVTICWDIVKEEALINVSLQQSEPKTWLSLPQNVSLNSNNFQ